MEQEKVALHKLILITKKQQDDFIYGRSCCFLFCFLFFYIQRFACCWSILSDYIRFSLFVYFFSSIQIQEKCSPQSLPSRR